MILLALALLAAAPAPRASADADLVVFVPRPDELPPLVSFFESAGRYSVALKPASWRQELFPLVVLNPADPGSFAARGLDPRLPLTLSVQGDAKISCAGVSDAAAFASAARPRLNALGDPYSSKRGVVGAQLLGDPVAGYALRGKQVCAVESAEHARAALEIARKLVAISPRPAPALSGASGSVLIWRPGAVALSLSGGPGRLAVQGRTFRGGKLALAGPGRSPYGAMRPSGLSSVRARLARGSLPVALGRLESVLAGACPRCDRRALSGWLAGLGDSLTGDVAWRADRLQVTGSLRPPAARFFALKQALVARAADPGRLKARILSAAKWPNAQRTERGVSLDMDGGQVEIGLAGADLFVGNDAAAVSALLAALPPAPSEMPHGAMVSADPKALARAFARVSLLELMRSRELAPLAVAWTELGPLLAASRSISGWADPGDGAGQRFAFDWVLEDVPDAGSW